MPLIRCPDCHKEISDQAPHCIHCGRPRNAAPPQAPPPPPPKNRLPAHTILSTVGIAALAAGIFCLVTEHPQYAAPLLLAGLAAAIGGGIWGWCARG
ncbi:MAG: hypothetical protein AB7E47_06925 [Desulfovibrionaceae bacterium]